MGRRAQLPRSEGLPVLIAAPPLGRHAVVRAGESVAALPLESGNDRVYVGPDSVYLVEAALRLAPRGERAVELGAGAGYLSIALSHRYRTVIATDVLPRAARFTQAAFGLNDLPFGHSAAVAVGDVAGGLRPRSFDLVAANTPWVPQPDPTVEPVLFAHGGSTGVELPLRFLLEGAALLRAGGVAITLALDVTLRDGSRPLRDACRQLEAEGLSTAMLPTPVNHVYAGFRDNMLRRQPALVDATHVAVVVGMPFAAGEARDSLMIAARAIGRRWAA